MNALLTPHSIPREIDGILTREDGPAWQAAQARGWDILAALPLGDNLGEGSYARARALTAPAGWIIKLTTDVSEARTWCAARRYRATRTHSGLAALPPVPGVWLLPGEPSTYAILQAQCTPLAEHAQAAAKQLLDKWGAWLCQEELPVEPPAGYGEEGSRYNALRLYRTIRTLRHLGFRWREPNPMNLMRDEDGYWGLVDLGGFTTPEGVSFAPLELPLFDLGAVRDTLTALPVRIVRAPVYQETMPSGELEPPHNPPPAVLAAHGLAVTPRADGYALLRNPTLTVRVVPLEEGRTWARVYSRARDDVDRALLRVRYVAQLSPTEVLLLHEDASDAPSTRVQRALRAFNSNGRGSPDDFLRTLDKDQREQGTRFLTTITWLKDIHGVALVDPRVGLDWAGDWRVLRLPASVGGPNPLPFDLAVFQAACAAPGDPPYVPPQHAEDTLLDAIIATLNKHVTSEAAQEALALPALRERARQILRAVRFPEALPTGAPWSATTPPGCLCRWVAGGSTVELVGELEGYTIIIHDDTRRTRTDDPQRTVFSNVTAASALKIITSALTTIAARTHPG